MCFLVLTPLDRAFLDCPQAHPTLRIRRVHYATRLWFCTPRHLACQVGAAWLSLDHRLGITMFQVASARRPELARQAPASAGWRQRVMLSQLVIKQVWGEHSFNKSQLAAYLTHVRKPAPAESRLRSHQARSGRKPAPVALSRLWWLSPAESRLRSHPRLYISVSPTLRGPTGNKTFSFVTR